MRTGDFLAGLLVGAVIGAAVGLLFAPEAGEETRERIQSGARRLGEAVKERAGGVLHRGEKKEESEA
jgi:gas vesicle protein